MGGIESRFNALLVEGKSLEALQLWHENTELQSCYRLNVPVKSSPDRDTPLNLATRAELKILVKDFLARGANPLHRNSKGMTALHIACVSARCGSRTGQRREEILQLLLDKVVEKCDKGSYVAFPELESSRAPSTRLASDPRTSHGWLLGSNLELEGTFVGQDCPQANGERQQFDLGIQDKSRNTPLHLAAASGLLSCVELLLAHGAPLFVYNVAGQTPCDVAGESKQLIIAKLLESKMVFTEGPEDQLQLSQPISRATKHKSFHNNHSLSCLKQEIIESVCGQLGISQFPAQAILMAYGWSEDLVIQAWEQDKRAACEKAGLDPDDVMNIGGELDSLVMMSLSMHQCGICYVDIPPSGTMRIPCGHHFCKDCWKQYLESQIKEGAGREIRCPGHKCHTLIQSEIVQDLVPDELFEKYSALHLQRFVDSSADIKWCPFPDCGLAVSFSLRQTGEVAECLNGADTSHGRGGACAGGPSDRKRKAVNVECEKGHGFCWHCMSEPHEPCDCELWTKWKEVISAMSRMEGAVVGQEAVANARWIVRFTKPCPHCSAPIQRNEGCNHMTCKKCHHGFCWVCLDPWSLHNHRTGGYFMCNRYKAQQKADQTVSKARQNMAEEYRRKAERELEEKKAKFQHYHERYINHLNSLELELQLLQRSKDKAEELAKMGQVLEKKVAAVRARTLMDSTRENSRSSPPLSRSPPSILAAMADGNFLEDIIRVLLNAHRLLSASYCIGYFIPDGRRDEQQAHETLQGKLEEAVEMLSQVVNRPYLNTPQSRMSEAARNVDYLCEEYLTEMREVAHVALLAQEELNPPRPPPSLPCAPSHPPVETLIPIPPLRRPVGSHGGIMDSLEIYLFGNPQSRTGEN